MKRVLFIGVPILLLLAFLLVVIPVIMPSLKDASVKRAESDLKIIQLVLDRYKNKFDSYPTTEKGLEDLISIGLLPKIPTDPWKGVYQYRLINTESYRLYSFGKNQINENGKGDDIHLDHD